MTQTRLTKTPNPIHMDLELKLTKIKRSGGSGLIKLDSGLEFEVKKLNFSEAGFVIIDTMCGKYIKHSGNYTFLTTSRNSNFG